MPESDRFLRDFNRYTGDGLPDAPVGAPLPIGDPRSGAFTPKKSELRAAFSVSLQEVADAAAGVDDFKNDLIVTASDGGAASVSFDPGTTTMSFVLPQGPQGPQGASGNGTGDMVGSANLGDVSDADLSLGNLGGTTAGVAVFKAVDTAAQRTALELGSAAEKDVTDDDDLNVDPGNIPTRGNVAANLANALNPVAAGNFNGSTSITEIVERGIGVTITRLSAGRYRVVLETAVPGMTVIPGGGTVAFGRNAPQVTIDSTTQFTIYSINHGNGAFVDCDYVSYLVLA